MTKIQHITASIGLGLIWSALVVYGLHQFVGFSASESPVATVIIVAIGCIFSTGAFSRNELS